MKYIPRVQLRQNDKVLLGLLISIFLVYSIGTFFLGSAIFVDVLRGYASMEQFLNGEEFNTLNYQLSSDSISYFVAWWTPGQYLLPYALKAIGLSLPAAKSILIVLFMGVSVVGYLRLFRFFRFTPSISLLAILLIITNHLFFWNSLMYFGGSLFELALLPWFLLFLLQIKTFNLKTGFVYFILALVLFTLKATFLMHVGIGLGVLLLDFKSRKKSELLTIILTGISILAVCYFSFLQFGETPSSSIDESTYNSIPNTIWNDLLTPFASVTGIPFVVGILIQKMFPYFAWIEYVGYTASLVLTVLTMLLFRKMWKRSEAETKVVIFAGVFLGAFILLFLLNKAVSYDYRHFAPLAFVFVPFLLKEAQSILKKEVLFKIAIGLLLLFNLSSFVLKRMDVSLSTSEIEGVSYSDMEAHIIRSFKENKHQLPENTTYFFLNEWNIMPAFKNENTIPVYLEKDRWFLSSGMELDDALAIDLKSELMKNRPSVVLYYYKDKEELFKLIEADKFEVISSSRYFSILLLR